MVGYPHHNIGGMMAEKWSDELPDDAFLSEADKIYMNVLTKIRDGIAKGFDFDSASAAVTIPDGVRRQDVLDDALKVIIAEEHFAKKGSLELISQKLNLPIERLEKARTEMLEDVEKSAVSAYYDNVEKGTEH
ncbi:MAG: hypothetical protein AB1499_18695 [Nitrospirota bacterium]